MAKRFLAWKRTGWMFALFMAVSAPGAPAQRAAGAEYQVKAAFLLNFAQFIQWPESSFPSPSSPISVGVLGDDPFGTILEQTFADQLVQQRRITVARSHKIEDLKNCHLLFVSRSERDRLPMIFASVQNSGVATVGEISEFTRRGGTINFYVEANKVRFEISETAAKRQGIKVSSQLLKRARLADSN